MDLKILLYLIQRVAWYSLQLKLFQLEQIRWNKFLVSKNVQPILKQEILTRTPKRRELGWDGFLIRENQVSVLLETAWILTDFLWHFSIGFWIFFCGDCIQSRLHFEGGKAYCNCWLMACLVSCNVGERNCRQACCRLSLRLLARFSAANALARQLPSQHLRGCAKTPLLLHQKSASYSYHVVRMDHNFAAPSICQNLRFESATDGLLLDTVCWLR